MKKYRIAIMAFAAMTILAGCKKQQIITPANTQMTFTATIGGDEGSKTELQGDYSVNWSNDDEILVYDGSNKGIYRTASGGTTTAVFTGGTTLSGSSYIAAYPTSYNGKETTFNGNTVEFKLPVLQPLKVGTFDKDVAPMVAKSSTKSLDFKNVCGAICIRLWGVSGCCINRIVVKSNNGAKINGTYTVKYSGDEFVASIGSDGSDVVCLTTTTPVTLSNEESDPTLIYVMLPKGTYEGGFNVKAYYGSEQVFSGDYAPANSIEPNLIKLLKVTKIETVVSVPEGAIPARFVVNGQPIYFSKGNLRCNISKDYVTKVWSFAGEQWDIIGKKNTVFADDPYIVGESINVDLFGWSKAGTSPSFYGTARVDAPYEENNHEFKDWGDKVDGDWFTLSNTQWGELLPADNNSVIRATITGLTGPRTQQEGIILLPQGYYNPVYKLKTGSFYTTNVFDIETWEKKIEPFGAVFLPAAGYRWNSENYAGQGYSTTGETVGVYGCYWSSTSSVETNEGSRCAHSCGFGPELLDRDNSKGKRKTGISVRLVINAD